MNASSGDGGASEARGFIEPRPASTSRMEPLSGLRFDDSFQRELPADPEASPQRRPVLNACFSRVRPTPVSAPRLLAHSPEVAALCEISPAEVHSPRFVAVFSGNELVAGMDPFAACYGGHQFGNWAGQLGDGRAITLGAVRNAQNERWELQLKGAGATPFSRSADGRAVVRSSVREFLCSEAMHHLGVPTTRALSLIATGDAVVRDMFYDGRPAPEPGAVVCRVAPSFLRFGNFEIFAARKDTKTLEALARYTLTQHFPELGPPSLDAYARCFEEVARRSAVLLAHWMRVGFVHGVMNTDNMSILGLTIDYGPYGWLDDFAPEWTPNTTDRNGRRYRYSHQPRIALWNLVRFAQALLPLGIAPERLEAGLDTYLETFGATLRRMVAGKLGLEALRVEAAPEPDGGEERGGALGIRLGDPLADELFDQILPLVETDMTIFFRRLALVRAAAPVFDRTDEAVLAPLADAYYAEPSAAERERIAGWLRRYTARLRDEGRSDEARREQMNAVNPKYVLRNYIAQLAIDRAEQGDGSRVNELLEVFRHPYDEQPEQEELAQKRPDWARHRAGCSMLSCSS
jgi:protein adenylyltransferase